MGRFVALTALPLAMLTAMYLAGCNSNGEADKKDGDKAEEHDHAHAHGPHDGALVELGDDEKYHAEWATDESGKVTVWILDGEAEKEVPIAAEKVTIDTKDQREASFDLAAVTARPATSRRFSSRSKGQGRAAGHPGNTRRRDHGHAESGRRRAAARGNAAQALVWSAATRRRV
jgi:uncharacterized lipoprotein